MGTKDDSFYALAVALGIFFALTIGFFVVPAIVNSSATYVGLDVVIITLALIVAAMFFLQLIFSIPSLRAYKFDGTNDRRLYERRMVGNRRSDPARANCDRRTKDRRRHQITTC